MNSSNDDKTRSEADAADWFTRLQSDDATAADWTAFEVWLGASTDNQPAFAAVENLWIDLESASPAALPQDLVAPFVNRGRLRVSVGAGVFGMAAALILAVAGAYFMRPGPPAAYTTVRTAKQQRKTVMLADGTTIELNAATALAYRLTRADRSVLLLSGEANFSVAHETSRGFTVVAADRRITDIGTVFDVARLDKSIEVTVNQGEVSVTSAAPSKEPATQVVAGRQLVHQVGDSRSTVRAVDVDAALAWRTGRLIYQDAPLSVVVSDLNRYFATPIRLRGPKAAGLRFSGVLVLDSEDAVVARLQTFLAVEVSHAPDAVWLSAH